MDASARRARALVERDPDSLLALDHPKLRWTTYRGDVLDRDAYVRGNTSGPLRWIAQQLEDVSVVVDGDTAVLTAVVVDEVERDGHRETFRLRLTQTFAGAHQTVKHPGEWSDGKFSLVEIAVPRGRATPLHRDPSDETFYVLEGEVLPRRRRGVRNKRRRHRLGETRRPARVRRHVRDGSWS